VADSKGSVVQRDQHVAGAIATVPFLMDYNVATTRGGCKSALLRPLLLVLSTRLAWRDNSCVGLWTS
jgi:hypothetical protein